MVTPLLLLAGGLVFGAGSIAYLRLIGLQTPDIRNRRLLLVVPLLLATIVLGDALRLLVAAPFGTTTMAAAASLVVGMLALSHTVLTNWFEVVLDAAMIAGCSLLITFGALVLVVPDALADPVATDLIAVLVTGWSIYVVWAMCDALPELQSVPRLVAFMGCAVLHWLGWVVVALDSSTPLRLASWLPALAFTASYLAGGVFTLLLARAAQPVSIGTPRPRSTFLPYVLSGATLIAIVPGLVVEPRFNRPLVYLVGSLCLAALITRQVLTLRGLGQITEHLRVRERYYRSLLADSTDVIMISSLDGRLNYVSPAADHVLGHGAAVEGDPVWTAMAVTEEAFRAAVVRLQSEGGSVLVEGRRGHLTLEAALSLREHEVLTSVRDVTERDRLRQRLHFLAYHDPLTGLVNRSRVLSRIAAMIGADEPCAVLFVDLDRFKQVNDTSGHTVGDQVLKQVAERLRRQMCDSDLVGRLGGDEFVAVLAGGREVAEHVAEALARSMTEPFDIEGRIYQLGASIGIALGTAGLLPDELIRQADLAMYDAKRRRRPWVRYEPQLARAALTRATTDVAVSKALRDRSLELYLQPLVALPGDRVETAEALLRWVDDTGTVCPPAQILDFARRTGQMAEITTWVLERAVDALAASAPHVAIAVNIPPEVLVSPGLPAQLGDLLARRGVAPSRMELEVTEDQLLEQAAASDSALRALRAMGMPVIIDDFGTGFSSLGYLVDLPIDGLKIDQRFTRVLPHSEAARSIVGGLVGIAGQLGLRVVAEGIENAEQHEWVCRLGVHLGQGFYYARPEPVDSLADIGQLGSWATSMRPASTSTAVPAPRQAPSDAAARLG